MSDETLTKIAYLAGGWFLVMLALSVLSQVAPFWVLPLFTFSSGLALLWVALRLFMPEDNVWRERLRKSFRLAVICGVVMLAVSYHVLAGNPFLPLWVSAAVTSVTGIGMWLRLWFIWTN